ncbi:MAG: LEA type 2 family protein [Pseudomonas sp.]
MTRSPGLMLIILLAGLFGLNGCAVFDRSYTEPEVQLANVQMLKSNLWEQSFRLRLRVDNPNSRNLPIRGMHYQVYLNNMRLATGVTDKAFNVPAYGSEYFDVTVRSNIWRHLGDLVKLVEHQQPVNYRIDGHIRTGLFLSPKLTLREEGTIDPSDMSF